MFIIYKKEKEYIYASAGEYMKMEFGNADFTAKLTMQFIINKFANIIYFIIKVIAKKIL